jgi:hypothetical protein
MPNSKFVPFNHNRTPAKPQDKREGRMPKTLKAKNPAKPDRGNTSERAVDTGDGLVRGNNIPKPLGK